ncbi:MAG: hypothetical protein GY757_47490 [bacterium]|nr:hypothetical protein [bacterium]
MFGNYIKTALRNIKRSKGYALINIAGLSAGIACAVMLLLWVFDEISYDRFHQNADRLHRVLIQADAYGKEPKVEAVTPIPLASVLPGECADIESASRVTRFVINFEIDGQSISQRGILADNPFFSMFSFQMLQGLPESALSDPSSLVITESMAKKYFKDRNPLGQTLSDSKNEFTITGVIKDVSSRSHLQFDFVAPFELKKKFGTRMDHWNDVSYYTYVLLSHKDALPVAQEQVNACVLKHKPGHEPAKFTYLLQPLKRIHLHSRFKFDLPGHGNINYVYIFSFTAFIVLILACINYMNLTVAQATGRVKEVGARKVLGALKKDISLQFFSESIILAAISALPALVLTDLLLPEFSRLSGKDLALSSFTFPQVAGFFIALILITGFISGSYPALYIAGLHPASILKPGSMGKKRGVLLKKILVVFQFALSVTLIIGTWMIFKQIQFMENRPLGYDREQLLYVFLDSDEKLRSHTIKNEFASLPAVRNITFLNSLPIYEGSGTNTIQWEGKPADKQVQTRVGSVDYDYADTLKIEMAAGRFFSKDIASDVSEGYVLNETAVKTMGLQNPVGKKFAWGKREGRIIGVIRDFQLRSAHYRVEPLFFIMFPKWYRYVCMRLDKENVPATIEALEKTWSRLFPGKSFDYRFLDDAYDALYRSDRRVGKIIGYFTFLAIFISCLGLFGLISYMAEQRRKEIGIRKVLGAGLAEIVVLMVKQFSGWLLVANVIAWPAAYFMVTGWLNGFAYRTDPDVGVFVFSSLGVMITALLTVSLKAARAGSNKPMESLKYE